MLLCSTCIFASMTPPQRLSFEETFASACALAVLASAVAAAVAVAVAAAAALA